MSLMRSYRARSRAGLPRALRAVAVALVVVAFGASAAAANAAWNVNIVRQAGSPGGTIPANTHYYTTIQAAVNASYKSDYVLIEPGIYEEAVKVTPEHSGIWIRGRNRNTVIIDGQNKPGNGIEIYKANNVWVENLTVRNFDTGSCDCGNEIWWNGGGGSKKIGATGWFGSYLTAYDTGLHGSYGIFTDNEENGSFENIYASGFNDSGLYIGACRECDALVTNATMENNSLGYSGSNSSGKLTIENSVFNHNLTGIAPNSENPGDGPPPLDGACNSRFNTSNTPTFASTNIRRCEFIRNNRVEENNNLSVPTNGSTEVAPWGVGIELPGDYAVQVEKNTIKNNPNNGVLGFEYPNPFPPTTPEEEIAKGYGTIFFQLSGNKISENKFSGNGYWPVGGGGSPYTGDLSLISGYAELFGGPPSTSVNNCASANSFADATFPANIEGVWGCQHSTTPLPGNGLPAAEYLLTLQGESKFIKEHVLPPQGQPVPPEQPTMPNFCEGIPANPDCPSGGAVALSAGTTTCNGTYYGSGSEVSVPAGDVCTLDWGTKVSGNVQVQQGGTLNDEGAVISGNLQVNNGASIQVEGGGSIGGNLQVQGLTGGPNSLCNTTVTGNVEVHNNSSHSPVQIGGCVDEPGLTVGGNLQVQNNAANVTVGRNAIKGNLQVQNNTSVVTVNENTAGGNIQVKNNTGGAGGSLAENGAGGSCELQNDSPTIAGSENKAGSGKINTCNRSA